VLNLKRRHSLRRGSLILDVTPLIDVVFLLLIFFMLSSSIIMQSGIKINLPSVSNAAAADINRVEIKITADNHLFLNGKQIEDKALSAFLEQEETKQKMVMIKGDQDASLGRIVKIWDLCKRAGITRLNLATELKASY
jgi:biopolymer transport protein ExbD